MHQAPGTKALRSQRSEVGGQRTDYFGFRIANCEFKSKETGERLVYWNNGMLGGRFGMMELWKNGTMGSGLGKNSVIHFIWFHSKFFYKS